MRQRLWIQTSKKAILENLAWRYGASINATSGRESSGVDHRERFKNVLESNFPVNQPTFAKHHYERWFSPQLNPKTVKSDVFIRKNEEILMQYILKLLHGARYIPISEQETVIADQNHHSLSTSISIDWQGLDKKFASHLNVYKSEKNTSKMLNSALIYHRGVDVSSKEGYFVGEKFNEIIIRGYEYASGPLRKSLSASVVLLKATFNRLTNTVPPAKAVAVADEVLEKYQRQRAGLSNLPMNISSLARKVTLKEPCYKNLVVFYRSTRNSNPYNVVGLSLRDLPLSDLKLLLPYQRVYLQYSDKIFFSLTALMIASTVYLSSTWTTTIVATTISVSRMLSRMLNLYFYYDAKVTNELSQYIYGKDSNLIPILESEYFDQLAKEMTVTYFVLAMSKHPLSIEQINNECKKLVKELCPQVNDFDADQGLSSLAKAGLLRTVEGTYSVKLPEEADS